MSRRNPRVRTILVVAALLFLVLAGLGTMASAGSRPAPDAWRIGVAQVGDEVGYRSFNPVGWTTYRVEPSMHVLDAWGRNVTAKALVRLHERSGGEPDVLLYHQGASAPFATVVTSGPRSNGDELHRSRSLSYDAHGGEGVEWNYPCLATGAWQGLSARELVGKPWAALCQQPWGRPDGEGVVSAVRAEAFQGRDAMRVEVRTVERLWIAYWFAPGEAYPLAADSCAAESFCTPDTAAAALVRTTFVPGEGGPALADPSGAAQRAASDYGEVTPEGPAGADIGPYPLHEALQVLASDAKLAQLREWRDAHPDAVLVEARATFRTASGGPVPGSPPGVDQRWDLAWIARDLSSRGASTTKNAGCVPAQGPVGTLVAPCYANSLRTVSVDAGYPATAGRQVRLDAAVRDAQTDDPAGSSLADVRWSREGTPGRTPVLDVTTRGPNGETAHRVSYNVTSGARLSTALPESVVPVAHEPAPREAPGGSRIASVEAKALAGSMLRAAVVPFALAGSSILAALFVAPRAPAFVVALYSRLSKRDVVEHPRRAAMLARLRERPGLGTSELALALHASEGATRHHLDVLVRAGLLTRLDVASGPRWFVAGSVERGRQAREAVLAADGAEARALRLIEHAPGIHAAQLARELGVTRPAAHFTLKRLRVKGLVREAKEGARTRLYPA